jgi:hypothetical protein
MSTYFLSREGIYLSDGETVNLVTLSVRPRWQRALRWPWLLWQFRKAGVSWLAAWNLMHCAIWYVPPSDGG